MMKGVIVAVLLLLCPLLAGAGDNLLVLTEENPPLNYSQDGSVTGCVTEIVQHLLIATGNGSTPIEVFPWARAYKVAQERDNILLYTTARTKARETLFKWVGPVGERDMWIWKLRERTDIQVTSLDDAKRYSFSIVPKSAVELYLSAHGFSEKQLDYMPHDTQTMTTFLLGRNDFVLKTRLGMAYSLRSLGKSAELVEPVLKLPSDGDYYLAFSRTTPDAVVARFQRALDEFKASGGYEEIYARWTR